ncbi:PREDICTED: prion-like-(Q/N-rich) domain-bearing protein 25 [Dufourea novaeangliae]|uniref:prion-like-(Q/N-rich) domain-bearing protein 25 n=1 Tax=Dufourea novaeangliae TaxID=178035 RepID=UPI0007673C3A|nr:PREDICTED: prion-like-(Q/N-rich) domain-bearing protein 25 [Dufourea novaeangliae]
MASPIEDFLLFVGSVIGIQTPENNVAVKEKLNNKWKCESNADCTAESSVCSNSTCQCTAGYIFNRFMTACIKVATAYGDNCVESIQCSRYLFNGGGCVNNACACVDGYYYVHGRCNAYRGLAEKCRYDYDCYVHTEYGAVFCDNGICQCSPGYYQREYRTCRPEGKKVGDACTIDKDCRFNGSAHCDNDFKCSIAQPDNTPESSYTYQVRQQYYSIESEADMGNCSTNQDCKHIGNAFCSQSGICVCERAHFFSQKGSRCVPELGESCETSDTAVIDYSECINGKWKCQQGRVTSVNNMECLKVTSKYQYSCLINEQCQIFGPDAICNDTNEGRKCFCGSNSRYIESEMFCWIKRGLNESCTKDIDCHIDGTSTKLSCTNNVCSCPSGTHANSNRTDCVENYVGINSTCITSNDCAPNNTECVEFNDSGKRYCACEKNYVAASFKSCVPVASFGDLCDIDIQCSTKVSNAICLETDNSDQNKTCSCRKGYHYKFQNCFEQKVLGESCRNLGECYLDSNVDRVVCKNGQCACDWGYIKVNSTMCGIHRNPPRYRNGTTINGISGGLLLIMLLLVNICSSIKL